MNRLLQLIFVCLAFSALAFAQETSAPQALSVSPRDLARAKSLSGFAYVDSKVFTCNGQSFQIPRFRHKQTELMFHLVPGGRYLRGSSARETVRIKSEGPVREVSIQPFLICATECTQAAWKSVVGAEPSKHSGAERPVERVSWIEVQGFCGKAGLRLPSEAEWEFACRAGAKSAYSFGDDPGALGRYAEFKNNSRGEPKSVAGKAPSAFGLHDMHGNVLEWCQDAWAGTYQDAPETGWPARKGSIRGSLRVVRGGSFWSGSARCRSAARSSYGPGAHRLDLGFRPAKSLP
ncbi:MAG: formylglycine-generating enzyme family protein [Planctomycetes bacterium]|nr:formylglycine-generating enzyme family protein [Planctomycetota bacterium]